MRLVFTDRNIRRAFSLFLFLLLLFLFRHLAILLVFFVLFERSLGSIAGLLRDKLKLPVGAGIAMQLLVSAGLFALAGLVLVGRIRR